MKSFNFVRNYIFRIAVMAIAFLFFCSQAGAQLSGGYTINPAGGNFAVDRNCKTIQEAVDTLMSQGVGGPVTFNIAEGTYVGRYTLMHLGSVNANDTILFQSVSDDSTDVVFIEDYYNDGSKNFLLNFDGLDYISFKGITFNATSGPYDYMGSVVTFTYAYSSHINFINCQFLGKPAGTSYENNSLIRCERRPHAYVSFRNCYFGSGEKGLYMQGNSSGDLSAGLEIRDCIFNNQGEHPIFLEFQESPVIHGNTINVSKDSYKGIYLTECTKEIRVTNNNVYVNNPTSAIHLIDCDGSAGLEGLVANNFVSVYAPQTSQDYMHGVELESCTNFWVYFNSVNIHGWWDGSSRAFFQDQAGSNIDIRNNIFANYAGGYASVIESAGSSVTPDYNNYYSVGNFLAQVGGDIKTDLADLQDGDPDDQHSISVNPVYTADQDLHTTNFLLSGKGDPDTDITDLLPEDIEGDARTPGSPDIGADEFASATGSPLSGNIKIGSGEAFETIIAAVDELNKYGTDGAPVTFNIKNDNSPYAGGFKIMPVTGATNSSRITFQPAEGNTGPVEIIHSGDDSYPSVIELGRASYITLKELTITVADENFPRALQLSGFCTNDSILDCTMNSLGSAVNTAALYSNENIFNNVYVGGNTIIDARYGIWMDAQNDVRSGNLEIVDNEVLSNVEYGIYLEDCDNPVVSGNIVVSDDDVANGYWWSIYLEDCHAGYLISGNEVINNDGDGGIRVNRCDGGASDFGLILNNSVHIKDGASEASGIMTTQSTYIKIFHNTIRIHPGATSTNTEAWYNDGGSDIYVKNNIFSNLGNGRMVYLRQDSPIEESDYNCFYYGGSIRFGRWDNTDYFSFEEYKTQSSTEAHSVIANPAFLSPDDLKSNSYFLDGKGILLTEVTTDMDGVTRDDPPDIGAWEFTSSLSPMSGPYTIGGETPDYTTVTEALDDIQIRGVSGPVSLEIRPGVYEEYLGAIYKITGTSPENNVVLKSATENPEDVTISYMPTYDDPNIFELKSMDYFTISHITISSLDASDGRPIRAIGRINCLNILNNRLVSANTGWSVLIIEDCITDSVCIRDNMFTKGNSSIYFHGYRDILSTSTEITGNEMAGSSAKGIYLNYHHEPIIMDNTVKNTTVGGFEGIQVDNSFGELIIAGNRITSTGSETGIDINNCEAIAPFYGLIYNNMVHFGGSGYTYGIYINNSDRMFIYHNSVHISAQRNDDIVYGLYTESNVNELELVNNIFYNSRSGYAMYIEDGSKIVLSDYNNLYSEDNDKFVRWGSTDYATIAEYRSASSMDGNSLNLNPLFLSETELYSGQPALYQAGTPLDDVPYDIDSVSRTITTNPDIGAAEFFCVEPDFNVEVLPSCFGDNTIFIDKSTKIAGGSTYFWSFDNDWNPEITSNISGDTIKHVFETAGEQQVKFWITQIAGCTDDTVINVTVNPLPVIDPEITGAYCGNDDGQVTINITEGTGPFNYYWSTGDTGKTVTGLALGTYTVAVSDKNNCTASEEIVIEEEMQVTVEQLQVSTCGTPTGQAVVNVTGGVKPYRYVWSNGDTARTNTSLSTGVHYVNVIDANDCYTRGFVNIGNDGTGPQIALDSLFDNNCFGDREGLIGISITGGTEPYTITWSNGSKEEVLVNLASGIYDVVVTDETGCIGSRSFEVSQPARINIDAIVENASCAGTDGKAVAVVSGGVQPYVYNWSSGSIFSLEDSLAAGVYSVQVTDANGCVQVEPVIVNNVGGPVPVIQTVTGVSCLNQNDGAISVLVSGGQGPYTYSWSPDAQITSSITDLTPGEYKVTVTDDKGCVGVNYASIVQDPPEVNPICLVTVDSASGKNLVVWEETIDQDVDYYVIYRETSLKGIYQPIGKSDEAGTFLDSVADPTIRSWRYKLSVVDACGVESELSGHHKTMHLTINLGIGRINLIWDHYEGFEVSTYKVWRYSAANGWENIADMPANLTSYTDMDPPEEDLTYYIEVLRDEPCTVPDLKAGTLNSSKSNRQRRLTTSAGDLSGQHNLSIFPNPGNGIFHISLDQTGSDNIDVKVYDLSGKLLYINEFVNIPSRFEGKIDLTGFAPGVYQIQMRTNNALYHRALIIE